MKKIYIILTILLFFIILFFASIEIGSRHVGRQRNQAQRIAKDALFLVTSEQVSNFKELSIRLKKENFLFNYILNPNFDFWNNLSKKNKSENYLLVMVVKDSKENKYFYIGVHYKENRFHGEILEKFPENPF